jgi:hypothetical protein
VSAAVLRENAGLRNKDKLTMKKSILPGRVVALLLMISRVITNFL